MKWSENMLLGFSGSKATEYIGAFYLGRLANDTTSGSPTLIQAGRANFGATFWGDYSHTTLDPTDGNTFWTVQEYADQPGGSEFWGTWFAKIRTNP